MKNNKVIYTAIFGRYDTLIEPTYLPEGWDLVCFTDTDFESETWEIRNVKGIFKDSTRDARKYKVLPHRWFKEYDYSLWVDGNFLIRGDVGELIDTYLKNTNIAIHNHEESADVRDCIYDESLAVIKLKKDDVDIVKEQMIKYQNDNYPHNNGLAVSGVILRRHNEEDCIIGMEKWWSEIDNGSKRDQLSFNYAMWKTNTPFSYIKGNIRETKHFLHNNHKKSKKRTILNNVIFENTPYRTDFNLIESYNSFMELLPDNGWAVFRDGDTLFLDSHYGQIIENAIKDNPDTDCFTCFTNRIACPKQTFMIYNGDDIVKHRQIAKMLREKFGSNCEDFSKPVIPNIMSGMVMILSKKAWKKIGGFKKWKPDYNDMLGVDNKLHLDLKKHNFKIKLIKGLYIYHWYRGGEGKDTSHLVINTDKNIKKILKPKKVLETKPKKVLETKPKKVLETKPKKVLERKPSDKKSKIVIRKTKKDRKFINIRRSVRLK